MSRLTIFGKVKVLLRKGALTRGSLWAYGSLTFQIDESTLTLILASVQYDFKDCYEFSNHYQFDEVTWRNQHGETIFTFKFWDIETGEHYQEMFKCCKTHRELICKKLESHCSVILQEF